MKGLGSDSSSVEFGVEGEGLPNNISNRDFDCRVGALVVALLLLPSVPDDASTLPGSDVPRGNVMLAVALVSGATIKSCSSSA